MAEMKITAEHPEYRKIMADAFLLLLDGKLRGQNEIVKYLEPYKPPEPPPPPPPVRRGRVAKKETPAGAGADQPKKRGRKPKAMINTASAVADVPTVASTVATPGKEAGKSKEPAKAEAKTTPAAAAKHPPSKPKPVPPKKAEK